MGPLVLSADFPDYQLLDSGRGRKLERFGDVILIRPEPKAWWRTATGEEQWGRAQAVFQDSGKWKFLRRNLDPSWNLSVCGTTLEVKLTDMSKHVGVFPEQEPHWSWLQERIKGRSQPRVLNLFGYTGAASLAAAKAGAHVTHVDASKPAIAWGKRNQEISGLQDAPVRWLLDDAFKFIAREIRRGNTYEAILLDPPSFGRGPKGEVWKVEEQIVDFLDHLRKLLSDQAACLILTMYNLEASSIMLHNLVQDMLPPGEVSSGELALTPKYGQSRLPLSLFCRWQPAQ
ncbi:MAG: class I SAM-dependent methyltransferase [Verrucomicrobiota bacterium JB022]|nr:class I SAM-dependent methyltransferase [Verrucomicrobiota bacterium JB022]